MAFGSIEVEDGGPVDDPVDGGHGGHFIFEDFIPVLEGQIGADQEAFALIAMGHEVKKHLHFPLALLHVTDVVQDDQIKGVEFFKFQIEPVFVMSPQEPGEQLVGGLEEDLDLFLQD